MANMDSDKDVHASRNYLPTMIEYWTTPKMGTTSMSYTLTLQKRSIRYCTGSLIVPHHDRGHRDLKHSTATSFADDMRIKLKIRTQQDADNLQQDLNEILRWAEENNMALNGDKFELLRYGHHLDLKNSTNYYCGQQVIIAKDVVEDLGVGMSSDASYHHINQTTLKARHLSGWILRTFQTRSPRCMLTLWKSLVLPHLEYCCQIWSPQKISEITEIEGPQRTFTSKIHGLQELNYWERLKELQLFSLQWHRERYIIIYIWKVLEKRVPNTGIQVTVHH
ncbi:uncharacterized protein LOC143035696 [Oratosquilla oratoria]|uniref:uncharacterized protein LOC143035696 n=1 Tax=Oratosquilla oratoria TaxID=337810 RepID=UPI003F759AEA